MRPRIFITRKLPKIASRLLGEHFEIESNDENKQLPAERLPAIVSEYDGVLSTIADKFTQEVLEKADKLKVVSNYATGLDNIDVKFANARGITVFSVGDVVTASTADLTFAIFLSLIRKILPAAEFVKENKWKRWEPEIFWGEELNGKTLGIVGFGKIGRAVAERAKGFGLKVLVYNRSEIKPESTLTRLGAEQVTLDELLSGSDYITVHVPLNESTRGMVNLDLFKMMSKKPVIINASRGPVVDTADLVTALEQGLVRGAALDVTDPEPIPGNHPLCGFENCLIVPHIGTATTECRQKMAVAAAQNIIGYFSNGENHKDGRQTDTR